MVFELNLFGVVKKQLHARSPFLLRLTDSCIFKTDCHLLLWLCFSATSLNMRLLAHTHTQRHFRSCSWTPPYWLKQTANTHTHSDKHTRVHFSFPHQQFFANDALVFMSRKNTLQNVWSLIIINHCMYFFFFSFFGKSLISITQLGLGKWFEVNWIVNHVHFKRLKSF